MNDNLSPEFKAKMEEYKARTGAIESDNEAHAALGIVGAIVIGVIAGSVSDSIFIGIAVGFLALIVILALSAYVENSSLSPEQREARRLIYLWGELNPALICPHCQTKGQVRTKQLDRKRGISGGKATAAILTAGASVLATGLSRKENVTQAHCDYCGSTWDF